MLMEKNEFFEILPYNKSWNNVTNFSHYAGIKFILHLKYIFSSVKSSKNQEESNFMSMEMSDDIVLTQMKKKNASSNEFWNMITWIKNRTIFGLLNQK